MSEQFDVVIVGGRCAGAPLAALLAREGVRVAVVEHARFPSDTLSTHAFEADALAFLNRLGLTDRLRATGAPFVNQADVRIEDVRFRTPWPQVSGDIGGWMSVRRHVLDPMLAEAALQAGADVRTQTRAIGLCERHGRVVGVRVTGDSGERDLHARIVVGADGRNSTVAQLSGSRRYNVVPNQRAVYWGYFEDAYTGPEPTFLSHRWGNRFVVALPTDAGLFQVLVWPELSEFGRYRRDHEALFREHVRCCEPLREALEPAHRVGKLRGALRWSGCFSEPCGPGWVLTGDAGHFKDPAIGRGIGDAFLQAETLSSALHTGLTGTTSDLDKEMIRWGRWRDREFAEHYWLASDLGRAGVLPAVLPEIVSRLHERGEAHTVLDLLNHRVKPSQVITPARTLQAAGGLLRRERGARTGALRELATLAGEDAKRAWLNRRPAFASDVQSGRIARSTRRLAAHGN